MSLVLSQEELRELTGYVRGKDQARWLGNKGWLFELDAHGRPKVARSYFEQKMGGASKAKRWRPDFSDLPVG